MKEVKAKLLENLANLIKVKTGLTFLVVGVFAVLALRGDIQPTDVVLLTGSVVGYYFGTQHEKKK